MYLQQIKCFKKTYLQQLDPVNDWFVLAVKVTFASLIAALLAITIIPKQNMFLITSTILFVITLPDASKKQQFIGMLLAGLLGSLGIFLATVSSQYLILLLIVTAIYAVIAMYLNRINPAYGIGGVMALLMVIIAGGMPGDTLIANERLMNSLLGLGIGFVKRYDGLFLSHLRRLFTHLS